MEVNDATQEVAQTQPFQEPPIDQSIKQKGYFLPIFVAIAIILVIGVGGYFIYQKQAIKPAITPQQVPQLTPSPIPDQTANWKTYTNTKYNFSLQYPAIYQHTFMEDVNKNEASPYAVKLLDIEDWHSGNSKTPGAGGYTGDHIQFLIHPNTGDSNSKIPPIGPNDKTVMVAGQLVLKSIGITIQVGPFEHNGTIYELHDDLSNGQRDTSNFDQMLATFKFTN